MKQQFYTGNSEWITRYTSWSSLTKGMSSSSSSSITALPPSSIKPRICFNMFCAAILFAAFFERAEPRNKTTYPDLFLIVWADWSNSVQTISIPGDIRFLAQQKHIWDSKQPWKLNRHSIIFNSLPNLSLFKRITLYLLKKADWSYQPFSWIFPSFTVHTNSLACGGPCSLVNSYTGGFISFFCVSSCNSPTGFPIPSPSGETTVGFLHIKHEDTCIHLSCTIQE